MLAQLTLVQAPLLVDPLQILNDPAAWIESWLGSAVAGNQAVNHPGWLADLFSNAFYYTGFTAPTDCQQRIGSCTDFGIWSALQSSGYLVLGLVLMFRLVKVMTDPRRQVRLGQWLVTDVLIRGSLAAFAISVSYLALAQLMQGSISVGGALFENIMSVGWANYSGPGGMSRATATLFSNVPPIPLLFEALVVLYLTLLVVASRVAMLFAIAVSPLLIPLYAYSGDNALITWWLRIVGQGLLVPVVLGALFAVAMAIILATDSSTAGAAIGPLFGPVTTVASLWFVGHAIRNLLSHLFPSHRTFYQGITTANQRLRLR